MRQSVKILRCIASVMTITGCITIPPDILKLPPQTLQNRQLQTRQYETTDEERMMAASAGVLQDLGFTLDNSEEKLGLLVASKERSAVNAGQVTAAFVLDLLVAMGGSQGHALAMTHHVQKIRASVVTKTGLEDGRMQVRATFQRVIWNRSGQISRTETLSDPELHQGFFEKLSKSAFLEEHKI